MRIFIKLIDDAGNVIEPELNLDHFLAIKFDFQSFSVDVKERKGKLDLFGSDCLIIEPESSNHIQVSVEDK